MASRPALHGLLPPRRQRTRRWSVVGALLAVVLAWGLTACSGPGSAETGDCVEPSGDDSYATVDCASAQLRVLERQDDLDGTCATVPGVTESYTDYTGGYSLCLGPLDADPATAVNVAAVGECLAGIDARTGAGGTDVHRVDCADPTAGAQVVSRTENTLPIGFECDDVPGSTTSYSWNLVETGGTNPPPSLDTTDVLFCLGPAGVDPQSSPDTAQAGDCLRETGDDPAYAKVDCAAPEATYRVVGRVDNSFLPLEMACSSASGTTSGIQNQSGISGYTLCLAPR